MNTSNPLFLRALQKEVLTTPPIWFMRQAGRYMPEYRKVRKNFKIAILLMKMLDFEAWKGFIIKEDWSQEGFGSIINGI